MEIIKWSLIGLVLIIVTLLAWLSFSTRETQISADANPQLKPCPGTPNCVSSLASQDEFKVAPLPLLDDDPARSWQRLLDATKAAGGEIVRQDDNYVHAVFTSSWFRFKDDVELRLQQDRIDVRSASRAGHSDLGKNRERVENLRRLYLQAEA